MPKRPHSDVDNDSEHSSDDVVSKQASLRRPIPIKYIDARTEEAPGPALHPVFPEGPFSSALFKMADITPKIVSTDKKFQATFSLKGCKKSDLVVVMHYVNLIVYGEFESKYNPLNESVDIDIRQGRHSCHLSSSIFFWFYSLPINVRHNDITADLSSDLYLTVTAPIKEEETESAEQDEVEGSRHINMIAARTEDAALHPVLTESHSDSLSPFSSLLFKMAVIAPKIVSNEKKFQATFCLKGFKNPHLDVEMKNGSPMLELTCKSKNNYNESGKFDEINVRQGNSCNCKLSSNLFSYSYSLPMNVRHGDITAELSSDLYLTVNAPMKEEEVDLTVNAPMTEEEVDRFVNIAETGCPYKPTETSASDAPAQPEGNM